jgi:hypothetical protein
MASHQRSEGSVTNGWGTTADNPGAGIRDIPEQLLRLDRGHHACLVHRTEDERVQAVATFIRAALDRHERCDYFASTQGTRLIKVALSELGMDVDTACHQGGLNFQTDRSAFVRSEQFDPALFLQRLQRLQREARVAGFSGHRFCGEMDWVLGPDISSDDLLEMEARLNGLFPGSDSLGLCQYSRERFPAPLLREALRSHPLALCNGDLHDNLFYEHPDMLLADASAERRVDWMIQRLAHVRAAERKLVNLSSRLADHAVENARLFAEADEAIRVRDEFLVVAAHELKTPLTALQLQLSCLERTPALQAGRKSP